MNIQDVVPLFVSAFGGATVASAVVLYLSKRIIETQISKALRKYQSELDQKSEVLKHELSIYAHEQNVGLSRLDEKRAEAIKDIYDLIVSWHNLFLDIFKPIESIGRELTEQELREWPTELVKVSGKILVKIKSSAIYFEKTSYRKIENFGKGALMKSRIFYKNMFKDIDISSITKDTDKLFERIKIEREKLENMPDFMEEAKESLVSEFRMLTKAERKQKENS